VAKRVEYIIVAENVIRCDQGGHESRNVNHIETLRSCYGDGHEH